ncbi:MAG: hypothetical protein IJS50_05190, partial [Desulfovibrio sp.]|nr:hypothetical protein [Desulfovibrio sp.]
MEESEKTVAQAEAEAMESSQASEVKDEPQTEKFIWHCQRMGGTDQVMLSTMAELRHLRELDPKLWGALSCPAQGLEFDQATLKLLDTDADQRIRMPEVLDAVEWLCQRVNDQADIPLEPSALPLAAIDDQKPEGLRLKTTALTILKTLGEDLTSITPAQVKTAAESAAGQSFNGDGILPPLPEMSEAVRQFVEAGLAVVGGVQDAGGAAGLNSELAQDFVHELEVWQNWRKDLASSPHPVEDTEGAWELLQELKAKVDDYFLRCELCAFAPQASAPLNAEVRLAEATDKADIALDDLLSMPLARIEANRDLPLKTGLNPVWAKSLSLFAEKVSPLLKNTSKLSKQDWQNIQEALAPYGTALQN